MNVCALGAHSNACRGLRSLAVRACARRNLRDNLSANTSRSVAHNACPSWPTNGMHYLQKNESCTRISYRKIHGESGGSSSFTMRARLGQLRRNGTPEIAFGVIILAVAGIDYILQARDDQEREDIYRQLEREVRLDEASTRKEDMEMINQGVALKAKFKCIIRKVPENFDGHKCLQNVKVGDVVNVIEEGVGPGGQYNLCSIVRAPAKNAGKNPVDDEQRVSIGWFPCSGLQKME